MRRRCCLCGKTHGECSAFTLMRDWPTRHEAFPRELCQGCADMNSVLWGDNMPAPLWFTMKILRWLLIVLGHDPEDFLIGRRLNDGK